MYVNKYDINHEAIYPHSDFKEFKYADKIVFVASTIVRKPDEDGVMRKIRVRMENTIHITYIDANEASILTEERRFRDHFSSEVYRAIMFTKPYDMTTSNTPYQMFPIDEDTRTEERRYVDYKAIYRPKD